MAKTEEDLIRALVEELKRYAQNPLHTQGQLTESYEVRHQRALDILAEGGAEDPAAAHEAMFVAVARGMVDLVRERGGQAAVDAMIADLDE